MGISQEEIVHNVQTISKGLEALRVEHQSILGGLQADDGGDQSEKCTLIENTLDKINLGLGEAQVISGLANHLQAVEAEKSKLRSQVCSPLILSFFYISFEGLKAH